MEQLTVASDHVDAYHGEKLMHRCELLFDEDQLTSAK